MRLSIFTTITDPEVRGDNWRDALDCYNDLADEVIVVDGSLPWFDPDRSDRWTTRVHSTWPQEFKWPLIGQQFQRGYEAANGDWVIHADLDFIFHEKDFATLRKVLTLNSGAPAVSFWKHQFILPDRYNLKSRLVVAVNKAKYGGRIRFNSGGDLCQPSLDGVELRPDDVPEARIAIYNYEKMTKNKKQITDDVGRMARAWSRHFGQTRRGLGFEDADAYDRWLQMLVGRFAKPQAHVALGDHPKYVQETIRNLRPGQWGHSGFGQLVQNDYAKGV